MGQDHPTKGFLKVKNMVDHILPEKSNRQVLMALSGGVDSAVAAYLLADQGYQLVGAFLKIPYWPFLPEDSASPVEKTSQAQGLEEARGICDRLGIPFLVIDCQKEFQQEVIDYFCQEYLAGQTPNPCITCNQKIKFGLLLDKAQSLGFSYLATGHYVQKQKNSLSGRYYLARAKDEVKDQSYFLYTLTQAQLQHCLLPLGDFTKSQVRALAQEFGLPMADKPESQEICFISKGHYADYLRARLGGSSEAQKGQILNRKGQIIGHHQGIFSYTIGQRRGIGLYNPNPLYVLAIDPQEKTIIVGEEHETYQTELLAHKLNWMLLPAIDQPLEVMAQIRYRHQPQAATLFPLTPNPDKPDKPDKPESKGSLKITCQEKDHRPSLGSVGETTMVRVCFHEPEKSIAPGQSIVFYHEKAILGGGVISNHLP